jgi:hypothetical protein
MNLHMPQEQTLSFSAEKVMPHVILNKKSKMAAKLKRTYRPREQ